MTTAQIVDRARRLLSVDRAKRFFSEELWSPHSDGDQGARSWARAATRLLQFAVMIGEGFYRDQLLLRASALTYIATLSVIPLLVVALSIVSSLGVGENLTELAVDLLTKGSPDSRDQLLAVVQDARRNLPSLGALGAGILFVTTVLALRHAETTLNDIYGVRRGRSWVRRFTDYLAVLIVAPLLTGVALSSAPLLRSDPIVSRLLDFPAFELLYELGLSHFPTLLLTLGFSFVYWFLPNTNVKVSSALLGGLVASILVTLSQGLYVQFMVGSARYDALFGTFAQLPLLLTWIYFAFAIFLLGAEVAFAHQNLTHYRREVRGEKLEPAEREAVGLRIALEVARAFRDRQGPWTADGLAETLDFPVRSVRSLLERLEASEVVSECGGEDREGAFQLGRPAEDICVGDILRAFRGDRRAAPELGVDPAGRAVRLVLGEIDTTLSSLADGRSLADLLRDVPPTPEAG